MSSRSMESIATRIFLGFPLTVRLAAEENDGRVRGCVITTHALLRQSAMLKTDQPDFMTAGQVLNDIRARLAGHYDINRIQELDEERPGIEQWLIQHYKQGRIDLPRFVQGFASEVRARGIEA